MPQKTTKRIAYIDWLRGFACLVMFQTHCYDSWLGGATRYSGFFRWSQLGGTLPAPLFLFMAGVSMSLVTDNLRKKGTSANQIARKMILGGGKIFLLALLFRLQEYLLAVGHAPWTDLLRVDTLNIIGVSLMMMGLACRIAAAGGGADPRRLRGRTILTAVACAAVIAVVTPQMWTSWQPHWRAWWMESYINGVHTFGVPQPWLFPIFPWTAFAFAGLAVGSLLLSDWARSRESAAFALAGAGGFALIALGLWLDARPLQLYAGYDFWHTSPNFFMVRVGVVMLILFASYLWCRWGSGEQGFSPLIEMGKSSLLVYWVHTEFVYGGLSILKKRSQGIVTATAGLIVIFVAMTLLTAFRNRFPTRKVEIGAFFRRTART
jgi:uncharacterized membrane protein